MKTNRGFAVLASIIILIPLMSCVSTPPPITGKPTDINTLAIDQPANSLTNADLITLFNIPASAQSGDPSTWQTYFNNQINQAYSKYRYLFVDANGNVTESAVGKGSVGARFKKIYVYYDMGLYRLVKFNNQDRKVGYLFRTIVELTTFGSTVDVSSIFSIAVSAKADIDQGSIESTVAGLSGTALRNFLVPITSLSEENIQKTIEGVAILNNKVKEGAKDVIVNPVLYPVGN